MGREDIPGGTKVIKGDGTITYYKDLKRDEVPDYIITEKWYKGNWKCIRRTSTVETEDGRKCDVGSVRIGTKIKLVIIPDIPSRCCAIC